MEEGTLVKPSVAKRQKTAQRATTKNAQKLRKSVSLFTGAGGMDVGFTKAGFEVIWANEILKDACETYSMNHEGVMKCGDIRDYLDELASLEDVEVVFGGPPCQGFSVAGKMNPNDERSKLIFSFFDVVERTKPKAFVLENVKALGLLSKWKPVRDKMFERAWELGYDYVELVVLNATHYGVPQKRERMFFIGIKSGEKIRSNGGIRHYLRKYEKKSPPVGEFFQKLGPAGSTRNASLCNAKITLAKAPVLRASAYSGMLFNGAGRPIDANGYSNTLPASMGGNRTPIIDENQVFRGGDSWVEEYHRLIAKGNRPESVEIPAHLRRITVEEAAMIQTFPASYQFAGGQSMKYLQIGNAVPCDLAYAVGAALNDALEDEGL
jgi:DNA (cytosine-5)-methyltransferase 1